MIEGLGSQAPVVIARHHEILRDQITVDDGVVRRTEGDLFFATFASPVAAVAAAVATQRALAEEPWPEGAEVRVRMGLHTGEARMAGDELVGLDIHRAARIMGVGWGGQVLLSDTTAGLVSPHLEDLSLQDLGLHRLKDLAEPERIHQVVGPGLRTSFPALRSLDAVPNNLPVQLTSFVGRRREVHEVSDLLARCRLLTLTGPGGTGKTRLSLQVAAEVADRYPDGVFFVPVASVTDPRLVMSAVAIALGLSNAGSQAPLDVVIEHLRTRRVLLVIDNLEQVLDAATDIAKLLAATHENVVLASSRAPLRISGEQEYPVPPMTLPGPPTTSLEEVVTSEAATLFAARAAAVRPGFQLTPDNAAAVTEITRRLDGLPLAIELAASRVRVLPVAAIAARLGDALDLLSSGARDLPARQRTLRGAIAWSHDLLDEPGRRLFARTSVFRGGATIDDLETVTGDGLDGDFFDVLVELVDHSLLRRLDVGASPRVLMLETIREFAAEQLATIGEAAELRRRHGDHFLALVEEAAPHLTGPEAGTWLDRLEADHDNIRAALRRAVRDQRTTVALRLVAATWRLWQIRGHLHEGSRHAAEVTALPDAGAHPRELAGAFEAGGGMAYWRADYDVAREQYERALALQRTLDDEAAVARSMYNLAFAYTPGEADHGVQAFRQALEAYERIGDELGIAKAHWGLAVGSFWAKDYAAVIEHADRCAPVFRALGETFDLAWALHMKGAAEYAYRRWDSARDLFLESLDMFVASDDASGVCLVVGDLAILAEGMGQAERALRLLGAVERLEEETGVGLLEPQMDVMPRPQRAEDAFDEATVAALRAEGRAMSRDEAIAYAREA